jgi:adenine-specific DNA methylase
MGTSVGRPKGNGAVPCPFLTEIARRLGRRETEALESAAVATSRDDRTATTARVAEIAAVAREIREVLGK